MKDDHIDGTPEFSQSERAEIRRIIQAQRDAERFWAMVRVWSAWVAGAVVGVYAVLEVIGKFIKKLGA